MNAVLGVRKREFGARQKLINETSVLIRRAPFVISFEIAIFLVHLREASQPNVDLREPLKTYEINTLRALFQLDIEALGTEQHNQIH